MAVTLLGGLAKGMRLAVPKGGRVRPTAVRLRRKFFDSRQDWSGWRFIDLCAGCGAMGLEAWSRGAAEVELVENSPQALRILAGNVAGLCRRHPQETDIRPIRVISKSVQAWLRGSPPAGEDVCLFFDPPYQESRPLLSVAAALMATGVGQFWLQSAHMEREIESLGAVELKRFTQGKNTICRYQISPVESPNGVF